MRLFSEEVKITSSNSPRNILQVKDFQEVFFGVFEVQINENKYVAEKISEENGNPIISVVVEDGDTIAQYPFLLLKGNQEIYFNSESEPVEIFESNIKIEEDDIDQEITQIVEQSFDNVEVIEDRKQEIIEEIKRVKRDAIKKSLEILEESKSRKIQNIKNETKKKEKALAKYLESARENLVDEFTNISEKIKKELIFNNDDKLDEIRESVDLKIKDIADQLNESLKNNFKNSSKLIDKSVKQLVKELYESNINPKVDKELKNIAEEIVDKVSEIDKNLNDKLNEKANVSLIESVNKELDAIRDANIELNNSLNKGVQKALSRVGNIDKKIIDISEKFDEKLSNAEQEITQYFDERISLIKEETLDITDEARNYFHNLIQESKQNLLSEIRKIKNEKPVEYILESKKGEPIVKDWTTIEKDWDKKIHDKFENYKTDLRKYISVYASGGGTNATQYQNGGVMNGNLTVLGSISASQYLGIQGGLTGDYLPLSGGTVSGNLAVSGLLSANRIAFNTGANLTAGVGQLTWNNSDGTLDLGLKGGSVILQIGQDTVARVVNKTGGDVLKSQYQVVRIRSTAEGGSQGQRLAIVLAQGNNDPNSIDTIGLVAEDISTNQEGFVTTNGVVHNINTTGSLQGETWSDGDVLYVSPTTAGVLTNVKPQAPNHTIVVGFVIYAHQNQGKIFVKVDNGYELNELHNVRINGVANNDVLVYDSLSSVWKNSNSLNVNGLSANRIFTTQLDAISANISIIDIKQYELSGFNVTGNCTVQGSVSSNDAIYGTNLVYTSTLAALSTNWDNTFNTVSSLSSNWQTSYTTLSTKANLIGGNLFSGTQTLNGMLSSNNAMYGTNLVYNTGDQTISGAKTFTDTISGGSSLRVYGAIQTTNGNLYLPNTGSTFFGIRSKISAAADGTINFRNFADTAYVPLSASNLVYLNGNTLGSDLTIGTNDNYNLNLETGNVTRMTILSSGDVTINNNATIVGNLSTSSVLLSTKDASNPGIYFVGRSAQNSPPSITQNSSDNLLITAALGTGKTIDIGSASNILSMRAVGLIITFANGSTGITTDGVNNVLALRNPQSTTTNLVSQEFRIYNTYTSATSAERTAFKYINNDFVISTESLPLSAPQRNMLFQTASATRMTILSSGEVGIGSNTLPSSILDINDSSASSKNVVLTLRNGNFGWWKLISSNSNNSGKLSFSSGNTAQTPLVLDGGGNVGIGTSTPNEKLTVAGNLSATGTVIAAGLSSTSDIEITDFTKGVILKSPDNSRWRLTVTNTGALSTTKL